jgi:hypothetical protein
MLLGLWLPATITADDSSQFNTELAAGAPVETRVDDELHVDVLDAGSSSRRLRRGSEAGLPLERLPPESRRLAEAVLDGLSLHRRLPVVRCESDPRVVQFFLQHPDVAVGIWRAMEISDMQLTRIGPQRYRSHSGDGSTGVLTVLHADGDQQLVHCEGQFKSPVMSRAIQASALFWIQARFEKDAQGREFATCTADVFVAFPSATVETAVRVVSPVSNRIADRNFHEVAMFIRMMHLAMTRQPGWIEQLAANLSGVAPERAQALLDTTAHVYVDSQRRLEQRSGQANLTPEALRLPVRGGPEAEAAGRADSASAPLRAASADSPKPK